MGQKHITAADVEVDSQNRMSTGPLATEAKQDAMAAVISPVDISVAGNAGNGALADVGDAVSLAGNGLVNITVANTSDAALTDFALLVQSGDGGGYDTILSGTDWQTASSLLRFTGVDDSGNHVNTLAAGERVAIMLDLGAARDIKFQAKAAAANKSLTVSGQAWR